MIVTILGLTWSAILIIYIIVSMSKDLTSIHNNHVLCTDLTKRKCNHCKDRFKCFTERA
jgi:hypothetical protein